MIDRKKGNPPQYNDPVLPKRGPPTWQEKKKKKKVPLRRTEKNTAEGTRSSPRVNHGFYGVYGVPIWSIGVCIEFSRSDEQNVERTPEAANSPSLLITKIVHTALCSKTHDYVPRLHIPRYIYIYCKIA